MTAPKTWVAFGGIDVVTCGKRKVPVIVEFVFTNERDALAAYKTQPGTAWSVRSGGKTAP